MTATVKVQYSCVCGLFDRTVHVRAMQPGEDLALWLRQAVIPVMGADHHSVRPRCISTQAFKVKIPIGADAQPVTVKEQQQ